MMPSWTAITQLHTARLRDAMPISTVRRADGKTIGVLPSVADEPHGPPNVEILRIGPSPGFYAAVIRLRDFACPFRASPTWSPIRKSWNDCTAASSASSARTSANRDEDCP
jgi:hypothetical protein